MKYLLVVSMFLFSSLSIANYDTGASDPESGNISSETVSINEDYSSSNSDKSYTEIETEEDSEAQYQVGTFVE